MIRTFPRRSKSGPRHRRAAAILSLLLALSLAVGAHAFLTPSERLVRGRAHAIDGDTLRLDGMKIRLKGIDAPELTQPCRRDGQPLLCGETARDALIAMLIRGPVECRLSGLDRYRRHLARCAVGGEDIGARMVADGAAVAYGDYRLLEMKARLRSAGIWATTFERPQAWRRHNSS